MVAVLQQVQAVQVTIQGIINGEYAGCSNYASGTKYCSKHTTYSKCSYPGCNNSVSYSGDKYCSTHELTLYKNK